MIRRAILFIALCLLFFSPAWAAFPVVEATNTSSQTSNTTAHTVMLPAGVVAGNLLVAFFTTDGNPAFSVPGGWSESFEVGTDPKGTVIWRLADGTESGGVVITTGSSERSCHISYRISGINPGGPINDPAGATGSGTAADPPSNTPGWVDDTLWLIAAAINASDNFSGNPPEPYGNELEVSSTGAGDGCRLRSLRRNFRFATENPGTFSNTSSPWLAWTIAIRPEIPVAVRRRPMGGP